MNNETYKERLIREYKELRKLGYGKETCRRAIHGDISHTVRYIKSDPTSSPFYRDSVGTEELHEDSNL